MEISGNTAQQPADARIDRFRKELGPFAATAEASCMPMVFTDGQEQGDPIVFANDAFLALTGFSHTAIMGERLELVLGNVTDSGTISSIRSVMTVGGTGNWEMQCRRADKSEFLAAVFLSPVRDSALVVRQNLLSFIKLGGHVERLLDQRNEFHALYERAPGFIATTAGAEHRFTFANASYERFIARGKLIGLTVSEALPEIIDQGFIALLDQVYRTGEAFVGENMPISILNPSTGLMESRYANFVYQAVRSADGVITGLFCEGYDVTEKHEVANTLAELQSELIHVSRVNAMGTMATTLAHELNQPLSAVANYIAGMRRLLENQKADDAQFMQALQGIEEASQRAAEILRNLRELTRRREPARVDFNLKAAVGECLRLVRATADPSVSIIKDISDDLVMSADRIQIQQVVINLLRNACDAVLTSDRRQVTIAAKQVEQFVIVSVIDTGAGVPITKAESIFQWSDSSKEGGMGLGLSICRTIIEAHRGKIWLAGSGLDGSEFCFSVPLASLPVQTGCVGEDLLCPEYREA